MGRNLRQAVGHDAIDAIDAIDARGAGSAPRRIGPSESVSGESWPGESRLAESESAERAELAVVIPFPGRSEAIPENVPEAREARRSGRRRAVRMPQPDRVRGCSTRTARSAGPARLTRRGRFIVTCVVALIAAFVAAGAASGIAGPEAADTSTTTVTVQPGESLWEIARSADPDADVRVIVDRIIELNKLDGGVLTPGQRLIVPAGT